MTLGQVQSFGVRVHPTMLALAGMGILAIFSNPLLLAGFGGLSIVVLVSRFRSRR